MSNRPRARTSHHRRPERRGRSHGIRVFVRALVEARDERGALRVDPRRVRQRPRLEARVPACVDVPVTAQNFRVAARGSRTCATRKPGAEVPRDGVEEAHGLRECEHEKRAHELARNHNNHEHEREKQTKRIRRRPRFARRAPLRPLPFLRRLSTLNVAEVANQNWAVAGNESEALSLMSRSRVKCLAVLKLRDPYVKCCHRT